MEKVRLPRTDHTGEKVGTRRVISFAGRDDNNKPRWNYKCTLCGTPSETTSTWDNLRARAKAAKENGTMQYCIHCPEWQNKSWVIIPNGTKVNNLVVTGPCFLDRELKSPGCPHGRRVVPTRCVKCGKKEPKEKANIINKRANCSCESQVALGLSNTPLGRMFHASQARSKKEGWEYNLTIEYLIELGIPETCPCLGIPLNKEIKERSENSPALDRIDNNKGYIKGNVWIISDRANRLKNDGNADELMKIALAVQKRLQNQAAQTE